MSKKQVVDEIHKAARKNFPRRPVLLKGIDDLWQADLIDLQSFYKINKGFRYILIIIDAFSKYVWALPIKTKTQVEVADYFEKTLQLGRVPNNLQTDLGKEFYNSLFKKLMTSYNINHYSTYSTKKASIVERVIRTVKNKLYKYFSLAGNYRWVGRPLENIIKSYNNTVHRTIKLKPIEVNHQNEGTVRTNIKKSWKTYKHKKNKFNVGDSVRVSKYKGSFQKGYTPNWSTEIFVIKKVNKSTPVTYYIQDQRGQLILGTFYEQELQKTKHPNIYLIEKVLKKQGNKLFVKWLGLSDEENSWIDKNMIT